MEWDKIAEEVTNKKRSALERFVMIKLAERTLKELAEPLIPFANTEYVRLAEGGKTNIPVLDGLAILNAFTPKSTWTYTEAVAALVAQLKKAQADEQAAGTAKNTPGVIDPKTAQLFAVKLAK